MGTRWLDGVRAVSRNSYKLKFVWMFHLIPEDGNNLITPYFQAHTESSIESCARNMFCSDPKRGIRLKELSDIKVKLRC